MPRPGPGTPTSTQRPIEGRALAWVGEAAGANRGDLAAEVAGGAREAKGAGALPREAVAEDTAGVMIEGRDPEVKVAKE
jgi:hypothetical protein